MLSVNSLVLTSAVQATVCSLSCPEEEAIADLFFLSVAVDLLQTVRSQLDVDESRATEVGRLLDMVNTTLVTMQQTTGRA